MDVWTLSRKQWEATGGIWAGGGQGELCNFKVTSAAVRGIRCPPSTSSKGPAPPVSKGCQAAALPPSSPHLDLRQEVLLGSPNKCTSNEPREVNFQPQFPRLRQQQCYLKGSDRHVGFSESVTRETSVDSEKTALENQPFSELERTSRAAPAPSEVGLYHIPFLT